MKIKERHSMSQRWSEIVDTVKIRRKVLKDDNLKPWIIKKVEKFQSNIKIIVIMSNSFVTLNIAE